MMAFSALLCGCGEQYKAYNEAKELMSHGTEEVDHYTLKGHDSVEFQMDYSCYEWAADRFDGLGDYKDSKELARECRYLAAIYFNELYIKKFPPHSKPYFDKTYLGRAYRLFVKAGEYKDAPAKAMECSAEMLKKGLDFNANRRSNESPVNIAELFQSFDENSKEQNAILLYQHVAPSLAAPNWGILIPFRSMPGLGDMDRRRDEDKKRNSFLGDIYYLKLIRQYYPVPDEIREKMYRAALSAAEHEHFWQMSGNRQLQTKIFEYLGDYKDSAEWYRRCNEFRNIPYIRDNGYRWQANRGGAPQARTIAIVLSDDGKNSTFLNAEIVMFGERLKNETNGNIYFTSDASEASVVIHFTVSYTFSRTFHYQRGSPVDYYNSKATIEIRSADGVLLLSETMRNNVTEPMSQIGFGVTKSYQPAPLYHPDILQILKNHFRANKGD